MNIMDTLFQFTEWLRTTPINDTALWLGTTPLSVWLGSHFWAIPILQTIHILSIAAAFGSVLMINLRVLGLRATSRTMTQTMDRYLPWIWWALLVLVLTGVGMSIAEPVRNLVNPFYWIKMSLIVVMVLITVWFQTLIHRNMAQWEMTHDGRVAIRSGAVGLILLWCAIMFAGRWIAYAPV